jgi:hypothetical protein
LKKERAEAFDLLKAYVFKMYDLYNARSHGKKSEAERLKMQNSDAAL